MAKGVSNSRCSRGTGQRRLRPAWALVALVAAGPALAVTAQESTQEEAVLGSASAFEAGTASADVRIEAGTRLHAQPHPHAPVVTIIDVELALSPLARDGEWVQVRFGGRVGWALVSDFPSAEVTDDIPNELPPMPPPQPPEPAQPRFEPLAPSVERLARATQLLETPEPAFDTGLFELHSDVKSKRSRDLCHGAAGTLPTTYQERYGLEAVREARFAVVIFNREKAYRLFEDEVTALSDLDAAGHAGSGVAALVAGQRTATEIGSLLVHELTHLLNRRAFLATPPPWLEEGLANDLAYSKFDRGGRVRPATLGGRSFLAEIPGGRDRFGRRAYRGTYHVQGPAASLNLLKRAALREELIPLPQFLDLTWSEFVTPEGRELRYVQSAFFVRYLLDGLNPAGFRSFLADFQAGGSAEGAALERAMGAELEGLMTGFQEWILAHPTGS